MRNFTRFLLFEFILLYYEIVFRVINFGFDFNFSFIYTIVFTCILAIILTILCGLLKPKASKIVTYIIVGLMAVWYCVEIVFKRIFNAFFSLSIFKIADQATSFMDTAIQQVIKNIWIILLFFIPLILLFIFIKKIKFKKLTLRGTLQYFAVMVLLITGTRLFLVHNTLEAHELFYKVNNLDMNMYKFGVVATNYLDLKKTITKFEEQIDDAHWEVDVPEETKYNNLDYDFETLYEETNNANVKAITKYVMNDTGTAQNEYTGLFKGKNLVFFMAESFNEIAVNKDLTPTLYKLVNSGFVFENFYTPYNLSTIGGEYQDLTGLMADRTILSTWRSGKNYLPYGLGKVFTDLDYQVQAYHNHTYTFQDRHKYLKASGFDNYMGKNNGLEKRMTFRWPASDLDMVNVTVDDYINSDKPFMTYYVTVSGHFDYEFALSDAASRNKNAVKGLPYNEHIKAYYAANIELDKALASLIDKLEEAGKLDDTVIVLVADHYPYGLTLNEINTIATYKKDGVIEINRSNLIIWNSQLETTKVSKTASQIDVIPTVYNLFGIDYDSRLFVGKDILSSEPGLAFFTDRSWVSDYGKYFAASNKFVAKEDVEIPENYVKLVNDIVANKMNISKLIMSSNYYEAARNYLKK